MEKRIFHLFTGAFWDIIPFPAPKRELEAGAVPFVLVTAVILATYFIYKKYGRKKK